MRRTTSNLLAATTYAVLLAVGFAVICVNAQFPVTVCVTCRVKREPQTMHAEYAARYYASEYPNLAVSTKLLGSYEASGTTQRTVIRALVANGSDCNVLVGPGTDTIALPMNPIVDLLWIDYSATSTELDSRYMYPLYSRVNPNDEDATKGYASFLQRLKWTNLDLLCVDQAYERSVVTGITAVLNGLGGSLTSPVCLQADASVAAVSAELARIQKSNRRVVFVAMSTSNPVWNSFVTAVKNVTGLTFLFSESACSSATQPWLVIPGAFCATFAVSSTQFAPFRAAYLARDRTWASNAYAALGWPQSAIDFTGTAVYPVYATDATRFALRALSQYAAQYGKMPATAAAAAAYMRNTTMVGATGIVAIPNGKRGASDMTIYNSRPNGTYVIVANSTATGVLTISDSLFVLGKDLMLNDVPASIIDMENVAEAATLNTNAIIIGVVVGALVVVSLIMVKVLRRQRSISRCPTDATKPFSVMFLGVKNSAELWEHCTVESMNRCTAQLSRIVRQCAAATDCHVARRVDDVTFMIVSKTAKQAVDCAAMLNEQSNMKAGWDTLLEQSADAVAIAVTSPMSHVSRMSGRGRVLHSAQQQRQRAGGSKSRDRGQKKGAAAGENIADSGSVQDYGTNGGTGTASNPPAVRDTNLFTLRVNIGVAHGFGAIDDARESSDSDDAGSISYMGAVVALAAAAADAALGGHVVVTETVVDAMDEDPEFGTVAGKFQSFKYIKCLAAVSVTSSISSNGQVHLFTFVPPGQKCEDIVEMLTSAEASMSQADVSKSFEPTGQAETGAIASALTRADCGVASRKVAVVVVHVPMLAGPPSAVMTDNYGRTVSRLVEEVTHCPNIQGPCPRSYRHSHRHHRQRRWQRRYRQRAGSRLFRRPCGPESYRSRSGRPRSRCGRCMRRRCVRHVRCRLRPGPSDRAGPCCRVGTGSAARGKGSWRPLRRHRGRLPRRDGEVQRGHGRRGLPARLGRSDDVGAPPQRL
jgi:hypothetical protein